MNKQDPITSQETKVPFLMVCILGLLTAFPPICTDIYLPAIPTITQELKASVSAMQLSLTACFFGLAVGQIIIGPISDAYGRKKPLLICLFVFVLASIACASVSEIFWLNLSRLIQGLSGAGALVLSRAMACDLYSGKMLTKFMALLMAINGVAPVIGPLVGSAIISFLPWPAIFITLALVGLVLYIAVERKISETLPIAQRQDNILNSIKSMFAQLRNMRFLFFALTCGFVMGGLFGYLASSPFILQVIYHLSVLEFSLIFAINSILIACCAQLTARLLAFMQEQTIVIFAIFIQLVMGIAMAFIVGLEPASPLFVCMVFAIFVAMIGPSQCAGFSLVMSSRSGGAGSASGIFGVLTFMFGAICSPLVGLMGETSMIPQMLCMLICPILVLGCFIIALRMPMLAVAQKEENNLQT